MHNQVSKKTFMERTEHLVLTQMKSTTGTVFFVGDGATFFNKIILPSSNLKAIFLHNWKRMFFLDLRANPWFLVYWLRRSRKFALSSNHSIIWRKDLYSHWYVSTLQLAPSYLTDFNFLYKIFYNHCHELSFITHLFMVFLHNRRAKILIHFWHNHITVWNLGCKKAPDSHETCSNITTWQRCTVMHPVCLLRERLKTSYSQLGL